MTKLYNGADHPLELGSTLGRGGEGTVHEIAGRPGFVAKVYHQPLGADKALKLDSMARQAHPSLLEIAAWPVDVLRLQPGGPTQGFVMPRVNGYREIHSLYGPAHRKQAFPQADWSFLVHAARNLASAFEAIHARGHVIGDVNPGNVVVSSQALVKLIDCDSFQISAGGRLFPCDVGVPQFTAPELQGQSFHGLRRTPDHDAFGLALLCFHLLFMGRHPFAGRYQGKGDMPIERAIRECRFAFGRHALTRQMEPPPHTLPFAVLSATIIDLFERAFAPPKLAQGRPSARDWRRALDQFGAELRGCARNGAHKYPRALPECPWCALEQASGTVFFVLLERFSADDPGIGPGSFDLESVWNPIQAIAPPPDEAMPTPAPGAGITPTPLPDGLRRIQRANALKAVAIGGVALAAMLFRGRLVWLWLPLAAVAWSLLRDDAVRREMQRRRLALFAARQEWVELRAAWSQQATGHAFAARLQALTALRDRYRALAAESQRDARRIETDQRQIQLRAFLESHFIDAAQIPGILITDQMALASYGIETAADITAEALKTVPGFGHRLGHQRAAALLGWRQALEQRFRYDPRQGADPAALARLHRQYAQERTRIERELLAGPNELTKLKAELLKQRAQLNIALMHQAMREAQAQADLRVFPPGLDALWRRRRG
ncbi:MAG: hypothetical protein RKO66_13810 [Candidatus Contendobacter sp.]|nr:hypothetical protein [Candidatus Contendobacter sp.]MDS4060403.1 hypothetical protein [Candidatus Contendobacter sp.]